MSGLKSFVICVYANFVKQIYIHHVHVGDEFHYLLCCVHFKEESRKYIEAKYYIRPSTIYLQEIFKQVKGEKLK